MSPQIFSATQTITDKMASAAVQQSSGHSTSFEPLTVKLSTQEEKVHHVKTTLNYYKDPGDGSEPTPADISKPETLEVPPQPLEVTVQDIRGREQNYSLDHNGFQVYSHRSIEKEFVDEDKIKSVYLPETEELLKKA